MKIYAPVKDFSGLRNNVRFVDGVGETDDAQSVAWFETHGYKIETVENPVENREFNLSIEAENEQIEPDFDKMTPNELRDWMKANGYGSKVKNIRSKEKLLDIIRG